MRKTFADAAERDMETLFHLAGMTADGMPAGAAAKVIRNIATYATQSATTLASACDTAAPRVVSPTRGGCTLS